ncbi:unnamed protein product [Mytilus edulis]|uniref:Uncharacterized protein n=1 Tax=Mytilus edulis TaxID=6550 RepID=A0A8S3QZE1_MYTED|nr:unnamed protein product [Mytilus edulis]
MAGIWDDNELTQKENIEREELALDEIFTKRHIADNTKTSLEQLYQEFQAIEKKMQKELTPVKQKIETSPYIASTPLNKPPAFGFLPMMSIDQTTQPESKAGAIPASSDKGSVQGPSALHGTISGMVTQSPFKCIEGTSTEHKPQHYITPTTATFASSYVGTPYVAQGIHVCTPLHVACTSCK